MNKAIILIFVCMCAQLCAYNDEPACFRQLQTSFFQPQLVSEALSIHAIDMNTWPLINQELQRRSQSIPTMLKQRTNGMLPNPLDYPFQPEVAGEILRLILLEIFTSVIDQFRISSGIIVNEADIKDMFGYIRRQQQDRLSACLGENAMQPPKKR